MKRPGYIESPTKALGKKCIQTSGMMMMTNETIDSETRYWRR